MFRRLLVAFDGASQALCWTPVSFEALDEDVDRSHQRMRDEAVARAPDAVARRDAA